MDLVSQRTKKKLSPGGERMSEAFCEEQKHIWSNGEWSEKLAMEERMGGSTERE